MSDKPTFPVPTWVPELATRYSAGAGHAFILHDNVDDYVGPDTDLTQYIPVFAQKMEPELMVFYDRAHGFTFPIPAMEQRFRELAGIQEPSAKQSNLAAMANIKQARLPSAPAESLPLIDRALHSGEKIVVVIRWAETIIPNNNGNGSPEDRNSVIFVTDWGTDAAISAAASLILLTTTDIGALHPQVTAPNSGWAPIQAKLPDADRRAAFIDAYANSVAWSFTWDITAAEMTRMTASLSLRHLEQILQTALYTNALTAKMVKDLKEELIRKEYGDLVNIIEPDTNFTDIGGLEHIKQFLLSQVVPPLKNGDADQAAKGILLTGPAGTGKTAMTEAFAGELGLTVFAINIGQVFGSLLGQTESTMRRMLLMIESAAPCCMFIDEIDQDVQRGGAGDSGASNRVFKALLTFMNKKENEGKIVVIAATNRPDLMDAALKRAGRFDYKIPFPVPNLKERLSIIDIYAAKYGLACSAWDIPVVTMAETEGWTGAALRQAMKKAVRLNRNDGLAPLDAIGKALKTTRDTTQDVDAMWALAVMECNDDDLLPPGYQRPAAEQLSASAAKLPTKKERKALI